MNTKSWFIPLAAALCTLTSIALAEDRPNILFIMSDDHTSQAIGAYGGRLAALNPTPTLDRLAREGMRFDRVFCVNSICTPSRASILTGQYPQRNGVLDLDGKLPPERQYLPIEMKKAGYLTAMIGKWHLEAEPGTFDYILPDKKPDRPLSAAMERLYTDYLAPTPEANELYSTFKFTPLEGLDYHNGDGTISRRDPSKVIRVNGRYYVWYTHRQTATPPRGAAQGTDTIPSTDWDLAEIWYATSEDGFKWQEQGVAIPRPPKPHPGWRSVSTADILVWKGKYYLYYQGFLEMSGKRGDDCPVTASVADSPDGPWRPCNKIIIPNGAPGEWDQYSIHDPYPLVYTGKVYLYFKSDFNNAQPHVRAHGLAIADEPLGPFTKHPLNPIMNSGHETTLFPFMEGIAAFAIHNGLEHNTIQYAPDGVNFRIAAVSSLMPVAAGPYVPDAFTDTKDGRGITWGLCHITAVGGPDQRHSILARFDCDLSRDANDPVMKQTDLYLKPEAYFSQGLGKQQREQRAKAARQPETP